MKIRTRILTAVLATATAFSCALTVSAAPTITLDNSTMPATLQKSGETQTATATLTLKASDFSNVKGAKITIELPDGMELKSAKILTADWELNENYAVNTTDRTVTLVDVFNFDANDAVKNLSLDLKLEVAGIDLAKKEISITGDFADEAADKVKTGNSTATLVFSKELNTYANKDAAKNEINNLDKRQYFIPYGGVYSETNNDFKYATKNANGGFNLDTIGEDVKVLTCELPTGDKTFTTFSSGNKPKNPDSDIVYEKENGIQFGTYVTEQYVEGKYGTLLIKGDYNAFRNYYNKTDAALLKAIVTRYNSTALNGKSLTLKGGTNSITVKMVPQTKFMWKGDSAFQYAVRLYGLEETDKSSYTAVAYSVNNGSYTFSNEIQTKVNPFYKAQ